MTKHNLNFILSVAFLLAAGIAWAQKDSLNKSDSINTAILQQYNERLAEIESQRLADSIRKVELETQIKALKTTEN